MSFILDALRKSDRRRRMNEAPDLSGATIGATTEESSPGRRFPGILLLVILLCIAALVLAYFQRDRIEDQWSAWVGSQPSSEAVDGRPETEASVPGAPAATAPAVSSGSQARDVATATYRERVETPRERIVSDPESAQREIDRLVAAQAGERTTDGRETTDPQSAESETPRRGQSVSRPAPRRERPSAATAQQVAEIERRLAEAQRRRELAAAGGDSPSAEEAADSSDSQPDKDDDDRWSPEAAEYVRAWELPLSIRRALPAMTLNIHVFSEQPEERFVLINSERYIIGDELPDGVRLVDIRREGAVVDYRDYRFLLEP